MTKLYHMPTKGKGSEGFTKQRHFQHEVQDLEPFIKNHPKLLGDNIRLIDVEIRIGGGNRIDLLGLEGKRGKSSNLWIIENKRHEAPANVLLQALRYTNYMSRHPHTVKRSLPKGVDVQTINLQPRVMVVAETIEDELIELGHGLDFEIKFVEIQRFEHRGQYFVVVRDKSNKRARWGWEELEEQAGLKKSTIEFGEKLWIGLERFNAEKGFSLSSRFVDSGISFFLGKKEVFGIEAITEEMSEYLERVPPRDHKGWYVWAVQAKDPGDTGIDIPEPHLWIWKSPYVYIVVKDVSELGDPNFVTLFERAFRHAKQKKGGSMK